MLGHFDPNFDPDVSMFLYPAYPQVNQKSTSAQLCHVYFWGRDICPLAFTDWPEGEIRQWL